MVCGSSNNNRFCDKDSNQNQIYDLIKFKALGKDALNENEFAYVACGSFHNVALTQDG